MGTDSPVADHSDVPSFKALAEEYGLKYLHTNPALKGDDGYLVMSYQNGDGLHMQQSGFKVILNYIRTHGYPKN